MAQNVERDPILEAYHLWIDQGWEDCAAGCTAVTSLMRVHQMMTRRADQILAPLDLTLRGDIDGWCERLQGTKLPTGTVRRAAGGAVTALPGYIEGAWWVQDAAAALPARLFGDIAGYTVMGEHLLEDIVKCVMVGLPAGLLLLVRRLFWFQDVVGMTSLSVALLALCANQGIRYLWRNA